MDKEYLCEAMLLGYKYFEDECERLDQKVLRSALASRTKVTYKALDEIIRLNNEKIAIINAKVIIDEALEELEHSQWLRAYYIDCTLSDTESAKATTQNKVRLQREWLTKIIFKRHSTQEVYQIVADSEMLLRKFKQCRGKNESDKNKPTKRN